MRVKTLLRKVLGLSRAVVICGFECHDGERPRLEVRSGYGPRPGSGAGAVGAGRWRHGTNHGGGEWRWRHVDVAFGTCELIAEAPRVSCPEHGPIVAAVAWARHDSAFSRAFEDLVVHDAIVANKQAAADRYGISWRAVNNACVRVATEALGRVDVLALPLVAIAIDEVKYKRASAT